MAIPKILGAQRDFSAGELDESIKRTDEHPLFKIGARQLSNFRILNSHSVQNRPGRTALFLETGRTEKVLMSPGNLFYLVFGNGYLRVYNAAGAQVFTSTVRGDGVAIAWTTGTVKNIVWTVAALSIYITYADGFPNNVPQILLWDGVSQTSNWTLSNYVEDNNAGQKRTAFYRISPQDVTLDPGARTGNMLFQFSAPLLTPAWAGTRLSFCGKQMIVTGVDPKTAAISNRVGALKAGDTIVGGTSGATGFLFSTTGNPVTSATISQTSTVAFVNGETITDSNGATATINSLTLVGGQAAGTQGTATAAETLPPSQTFTGSVSGHINLGDLVVGATTGAKGIITSSGLAQSFTLQCNPSTLVAVPLGTTVSGGTSGATGIVVARGQVTTSGGFDFAPFTVNITSGTTVFQGSETLTFGNGLTGGIVANSISGSSAIVAQVIPSGGTIITFSGSEKIVGPAGSISLTAVTSGQPTGVSVWADEVMNPTLRGYAQSVAYDQNRLIFSNIPSVPSGVIWSTVGLVTDIWADAQDAGITPSSAIFTLAPGKSQVFFILPGPESGEFAFCDNRVYYIPITVTNPLSALGVVAFNVLSSDGAANVQPRPVEEVIFYVNAGNLRVKAVIAPGAYYRPFNTLDTTENHTHLFSNVIAIAAPTSDATFPERYVYALNANGSLVVGKYKVEDGKIVGPVGWAPWSGAGATNWISAQFAELTMWTTYAPNAIPAVNVIEKLDDTQYLDGAMPYNNVPVALTPPGGKGPLWWLASGSVTLMDTGARMMGTYQIDANGFLIHQFNAGEDFTSVGLTCGQPWTATVEPFVADAQPGQSQHQRMFKRRVSRMAVYVSNSTGFLMARLFAGPLTRTSPALGTVMNTRRVPTWNQDDDPTKPPPQREEAQRWRPRGRAYDPRVAVIKDTPGPLLVHEIGLEATI